MSGPWDGPRVFLSVLAVLLVAKHAGSWVLRSVGEPERAPQWLVALVAVGVVAFIGWVVSWWLALPPVTGG